MDFLLPIDIPELPQKIQYNKGVFLIGSCFSEHISDRLSQHKFSVLSNPSGILFNPLSVAESLDYYTSEKTFLPEDLFYLNELWNSWSHHTRFSDIQQEAVLSRINQSIQQAAAFLKHASHVLITLGSGFQYYLKDSERPVANNHRAPAQWFEKRLLSITSITESLSHSLSRIRAINPEVTFVFTISPVRHIRDGVIENNRSKARLIDAVHQLCREVKNCHYFPAYELVIDVLRDYRFYDTDLAHPNYAATTYVWERFVESCIDPGARTLMPRILDIMTARQHKPRFPETQAHQKFLESYAAKTKQLQQEFPYLDLTDEYAYFKNVSSS